MSMRVGYEKPVNCFAKQRKKRRIFTKKEKARTIEKIEKKRTLDDTGLTQQHFDYNRQKICSFFFGCSTREFFSFL